MDYFSIMSQIIKEEESKIEKNVFDTEVINTIIENSYLILREVNDADAIASLRIQFVQLLAEASRRGLITHEEYTDKSNTFIFAVTRVLNNLEQSNDISKYIGRVYSYNSLTIDKDPFGSISCKTLQMLLDFPCKLKKLVESQIFAQAILQYIMDQYDIASKAGSQAAYENIMSTLNRLVVLKFLTPEESEALQETINKATRYNIIKALSDILHVDIAGNEELQTSLFSEVLVYSSGEISVRKLADSLPVYVEVKSEYETSFFDEEDDT